VTSRRQYHLMLVILVQVAQHSVSAGGVDSQGLPGRLQLRTL